MQESVTLSKPACAIKFIAPFETLPISPYSVHSTKTFEISFSPCGINFCCDGITSNLTGGLFPIAVVVNKKPSGTKVSNATGVAL